MQSSRILCRYSRKLLPYSSNVINNNIFSGVRGLFGNAALGIENYVKARERVQTQFMNLSDNFRTKMLEFTNPDSKNMIFTDDLKSMVHLMENNPSDIELVIKMMKRFNSQNKELRFGSFVFGPVVMRAFHYLNLPKIALKAFNDPEMDGFFDQLMSYHLLMNLLFKNSMYEEVLGVFDAVTAKQLHGAKYPKNVVILAMAACYKLNTKEHFEYAMSQWKKMQELGHVPVRRAITFAAALAINQNSPHIALEILSCTQHTNYITVRNLKVAALSDLGRPEDVLPILRGIIEQDNPEQNKQTFTIDVMDKIKRSINESTNSEVKKEYTRVEKMLTEGGHISDKVLDDHLCSEIVLSSTPGRVFEDSNRSAFANSFHRQPQPNNRRSLPRHYRQSLRDME